MTLSLAYSPCPNDTFIFYAMTHGKVDCEGLEFELVLEDVKELNQAAKVGKYDISKLSFHALFHVQDKYQLLQSGAALGNNCGPLLIAKKPFSDEDIRTASVAIPGAWTTANFLLDFAYPKVGKKDIMIFSEIEDAVLNGKNDLGLIIHENRFTYQDKGLVRIKDLGDHWEKEIGLPIPLGGIAIHKKHGDDLKEKVERIIRRSLEYAWANVEETLPYLRKHAQEMNDQVMMQHVNLYVNDYSLDLGKKGNQAVKVLFDTLSGK